jgi:hypothetical protein
LGEYAYYNEQSSLVACNVFDVSAADPREHFLASLIVSFLSAGSGIKDNDGFVGGVDILNEMATHGFNDDQVRHSLRRLALRRLIETPYAHYREIKVPDREPPEQFHYRATSIGIYHVKFWMGSFGFLDATSTDTPIFDAAARDEVFKSANSFDISDRYQKTDCFRSYLDSQWHLSNIDANYLDLTAIFQLQNSTFTAVERFVERVRSKS